jgi:ABC-type branched-subunit amino acid transport system ATPase component
VTQHKLQQQLRPGAATEFCCPRRKGPSPKTAKQPTAPEWHEIARRQEAVYGLLPELRDLAGRRAAGLSGRQGKMVALGRALMTGTRAVLLDEPFQGLAPALALRYAEALARLRTALPDVAILITESSPELLGPLVDTTYVIERGEIAAL